MANQTPTLKETNVRDEHELVVQARGISHSFGDLSVLEGVSFGLAKGTVACLIGPNGSGKTTLLRIVASVLSPDTGSVSVSGDGTRTVGYLTQRPAFRPQFTVAETVSFYASLVGTETDVGAMLDRVGLSPVGDRRVSALSGGMMRLLGLVQTLVGDPSVLVLDEPSSGLDPTMTRHITDVIADLRTEGKTVLLATHDLRSVERVADEVLILGRGELVANAAPETVLAETGTDTLEDALDALTGSGAVAVTAGRQGGDDQ